MKHLENGLTTTLRDAAQRVISHYIKGLTQSKNKVGHFEKSK